MDKIWYRNLLKSEVIGRCGGDEKKRMTTQNRQKSNDKKNKKNIHFDCNDILQGRLFDILVNL